MTEVIIDGVNYIPKPECPADNGLDEKGLGRVWTWFTWGDRDYCCVENTGMTCAMLTQAGNCVIWDKGDFAVKEVIYIGTSTPGCRLDGTPVLKSMWRMQWSNNDIESYTDYKVVKDIRENEYCLEILTGINKGASATWANPQTLRDEMEFIGMSLLALEFKNDKSERKEQVSEFVNGVTIKAPVTEVIENRKGSSALETAGEDTVQNTISSLNAKCATLEAELTRALTERASAIDGLHMCRKWEENVNQWRLNRINEALIEAGERSEFTCKSFRHALLG